MESAQKQRKWAITDGEFFAGHSGKLSTYDRDEAMKWAEITKCMVVDAKEFMKAYDAGECGKYKDAESCENCLGYIAEGGQRTDDDVLLCKECWAALGDEMLNETRELG